MPTSNQVITMTTTGLIAEIGLLIAGGGPLALTALGLSNLVTILTATTGGNDPVAAAITALSAPLLSAINGINGNITNTNSAISSVEAGILALTDTIGIGNGHLGDLVTKLDALTAIPDIVTKLGLMRGDTQSIATELAEGSDGTIADSIAAVHGAVNGVGDRIAAETVPIVATNTLLQANVLNLVTAVNGIQANIVTAINAVAADVVAGNTQFGTLFASASYGGIVATIGAIADKLLLTNSGIGNVTTAVNSVAASETGGGGGTTDFTGVVTALTTLNSIMTGQASTMTTIQTDLATIQTDLAPSGGTSGGGGGTLVGGPVEAAGFTLPGGGITFSIGTQFPGGVYSSTGTQIAAPGTTLVASQHYTAGFTLPGGATQTTSSGGGGGTVGTGTIAAELTAQAATLVNIQAGITALLGITSAITSVAGYLRGPSGDRIASILDAI